MNGPCADIYNQTAFLRYADKTRRWNLAVLSVVPANERFDASHRIVAQAEFRLKPEIEQILAHCAPQSGFKLEPVAQSRAHRRRIHGDARCRRILPGAWRC